jgi:hypothetical protein
VKVKVVSVFEPDNVTRVFVRLTGVFVHLGVVYPQTAEYRKGFKYRYIAVREGVSITLQNTIYHHHHHREKMICMAAP